MYNHSLPKIFSVLSITRRKPVLPVVSTVDDMKWNIMAMNNVLRKIGRSPSTEGKVNGAA